MAAGPGQGLYATEQAGDLIPPLERVNKRHVPVAILVFEAALSSMFALLFLFVPSINTGYWMLTALTTQLVLLMYMQVFASAIRLRYAEPNTNRPYRVPGGKVGIWIVGCIGLVGCLFGFLMGFIPPTGVKHWATPVYVGAMVLGIVITSTPPFIIEKVKKRSWVMDHPDPALVDTETASPAAPKLTQPRAVHNDTNDGDGAEINSRRHGRTPTAQGRSMAGKCARTIAVHAVCATSTEALEQAKFPEYAVPDSSVSTRPSRGRNENDPATDLHGRTSGRIVKLEPQRP